MLIVTTDGLLEETDLKVYVKEETVPCGKAQTTSYFVDECNILRLVRQDIAIVVDEGMLVKGAVNL